STGVAGAAAIAAAVSTAMLPSSTLVDVVRSALDAAEQGNEIGATEGREVPGPLVANRIELAVHIASTARNLDDAIVQIAQHVGTGLQTTEAVPAALG